MEKDNTIFYAPICVASILILMIIYVGFGSWGEVGKFILDNLLIAGLGILLAVIIPAVVVFETTMEGHTGK